MQYASFAGFGEEVVMGNELEIQLEDAILETLLCKITWVVLLRLYTNQIFILDSSSLKHIKHL